MRLCVCGMCEKGLASRWVKVHALLIVLIIFLFAAGASLRSLMRPAAAITCCDLLK